MPLAPKEEMIHTMRNCGGYCRRILARGLAARAAVPVEWSGDENRLSGHLK